MPWCCGHGERRLSRTTQQRMRSDPEPHCPLAHDAAIAPTPRAVQPWSAATRAASTVAHQPRRATFARCPKQPRRREFGTKLLMDSPFWPDAPNLASPARYPWRQLARRPRDTVTNPSELKAQRCDSCRQASDLGPPTAQHEFDEGLALGLSIHKGRAANHGVRIRGRGSASHHHSAVAASDVDQPPLAEQSDSAMRGADRDVVRLRKLLPARHKRSRGEEAAAENLGP